MIKKSFSNVGTTFSFDVFYFILGWALDGVNIICNIGPKFKENSKKYTHSPNMRNNSKKYPTPQNQTENGSDSSQIGWNLSNHH